MNDARWLGPFCAAMSSVTWAVGTATYSKLAKKYSAISVNLARGLTAFPLFLMAAFVGGAFRGDTLADFRALDGRHLVMLVGSIISSYAVGDVLFLVSARSIGIPAALTISSSYPLLTASWGAFMQGESLSGPQTAGLLITVAGVAAVILCTPKVESIEALELEAAGGEGASVKPLSSAPLAPGRAKGIFFAFGSALCWAANSVLIMKGGQGISVAVANSIRMGVGILVCGGMAYALLPREKIWVAFEDYKKWWWAFVFETFGGSYFFLYGLVHTRIAIGSTLASLAPVISVPIAVFLGLESFSLKRTLGVLTVVVGLWLLVGGGF